MDSQHQPSLDMSASSIAQLGQAIKDNAEKIEEYLNRNSIAKPNFGLGGPPRLDLPSNLEGARQELFDDMEHLTALLRGPLGHILTHSNPVVSCTMVCVAYAC